MEDKKYIHPHICICGRCEGTGKIVVYKQMDVLKMNPQTITCDLCNGTGRVVVKEETTITTSAYDPNKELTLQ